MVLITETVLKRSGIKPRFLFFIFGIKKLKTRKNIGISFLRIFTIELFLTKYVLRNKIEHEYIFCDSDLAINDCF